MRKHIKAMLAMITTYSTLTNATKRQIMIGKLPGRIVYATTATENSTCQLPAPHLSAMDTNNWQKED
jgi:hypothetical protein